LLDVLLIGLQKGLWEVMEGSFTRLGDRSRAEMRRLIWRLY
jgi:hypothetical protein